MNTRFELLSDERGRVAFSLIDNDGEILLEGLPCQGKIAAQTEVMRTRKSVAEAGSLVPHEGKDGMHFVVLKDPAGDVLARSRRVGTAAELAGLVDEIRAAAAAAPIIDHIRRPVRS